MGVIVRYILRELGLTFLFGFVALTSVLLIVGLVRTALDMGLPLFCVWQIVPYVFFFMTSISLPVSLLLAVTVFFARMAGNNEVTALKALGISPTTFLMPVFVIAFIVSIIGFEINEQAITRGRKGLNAIIYSNTEYILMEQLRKKHSFETKNKQILIKVKGVDERNRLIEPMIMVKRESITVEAQSAEITINFDTKMLTVTFTGIRVTGSNLFLSGGNQKLPISLSELMPTSDSNRPSDLGVDQINNEQIKAAEEIEQQRRIIAAHKTFAACMGSVDAWTTLDDAKERIKALQSHRDRLSVEPPRRWATGFCCFFFVWLGAPLAIWMRKSDFFASFFACFVPILLLFYPLFAFGLSQAKSGALPPNCVWLANGCIGLIGLWFLRQIHRY
jgi:lipopolysaccharide export system permease protein